MKLKVKQPFSWAHQGVAIEEYEVGQEIETDDQDLIAVAKSEGWAAPVGGRSKAKGNDDAAANTH